MQKKKFIKGIFSKLNIFFNRNPNIERHTESKRYIPAPYKSVVIISADFELAWAWRFTKSSPNPLAEAVNKARQARKNIPRILEICEQFNIPITWATVGHLFLDRCNRKNGKPHPELPRLPYFKNQFWDFNQGDWFDCDPCTEWQFAPEWYAPDLIKKILDSTVNHEMACHTFSHIDCRDEVCSTELFVKEIEACQNAAQQYQVELKSFVHPGFTVGNLNTLKHLGFTSFRTNDGNILGLPQKHSSGLWELKGTMEFTFREEWSANYHIYRYQKIVERAMKNNALCVFWLHPSMNPRFVAEVMPKLFEFLNAGSEEILVTNTRNYTEWLENENK